MVRDYKITTTVNKKAYLRLRGELLLTGQSFSDWLDKILEGAETLELAIAQSPKLMSDKEIKKAQHEEKEVEKKFKSLPTLKRLNQMEANISPLLSASIEKTEKIVKKVSKSETCPHGISTSGFCRKCAELV